MKERPILFSGPMVRAILAGTKTQTRRALGGPNADIAGDYELRGLQDYPDGTTRAVFDHHAEEPFSVRCPYGKPGDRLVVRETFALHHAWDDFPPSRGGPASKRVWYRVDEPNAIDGRGKWRPSIHMPHWASRILLEVTDVRVERLHDISEEDAIAEGVEAVGSRWRNYMPEREASGISTSVAPRHSFMTLWESINGTASWAANPWVWVVSFRRVER